MLEVLSVCVANRTKQKDAEAPRPRLSAMQVCSALTHPTVLHGRLGAPAVQASYHSRGLRALALLREKTEGFLQPDRAHRYRDSRGACWCSQAGTRLHGEAQVRGPQRRSPGGRAPAAAGEKPGRVPGFRVQVSRTPGAVRAAWGAVFSGARR